MQNILKHGQRQADRWLLLRADEDGGLPEHPPGEDIIVPWRSWAAVSASPSHGRLAVCLAPDDEPAELLPLLEKVELIAIDFPVFTDGRGYSLARLLRERYSYRGELRALGDIGLDQLQPLWLVGFDSFEIKQDKLFERCATALEAFSDTYQSNYRQPQPLFRRSIKSA